MTKRYIGSAVSQHARIPWHYSMRIVNSIIFGSTVLPIKTIDTSELLKTAIFNILGAFRTNNHRIDCTRISSWTESSQSDTKQQPDRTRQAQQADSSTSLLRTLSTYAKFEPDGQKTTDN